VQKQLVLRSPGLPRGKVGTSQPATVL
jgi:hypothetical protein